jgi:hypothetical protein
MPIGNDATDKDADDLPRKTRTGKRQTFLRVIPA